MEKKLLNLLTALCIVALPFLFKGPKMRENLVIFFSKGVIATLLDAYVVGTKRLEYPVRPFPNIFKTNIIYDILFFPLLSVIWVKLSYNDHLGKILLKSLLFSVPMSIGQWYFEKNSGLFKWKKWTPYHTFSSVNFTLFTIRGLVGLIKKLDKLKSA
ncbi:CBO0543 family protein [Neobacillus sp. YX16]|uniref:CBO0543 family protein n=1 Tax=Neobacillus sp. YX16 TaxID=3047874 RepID=UPI0024C38F0E|nr:CBO0543 family protein [Neobacillus sp. YX16]WHZ03803.1 CBO0543 family protein [Neobacillus sp. YX16]